MEIPDRCDPDLFLPPATAAACKDVFRRHVSNVILELHSRCNRACSFCPTRFRREHAALQPSLLGIVLRQLQEIDYAGLLCTQWFNEPLMELDTLYRTLECMRREVPRAVTMFSTNGDLLTPEVLNRLDTAGLRRLTISVHPRGEYRDVTMLNAVMAMAEQTGLALRFSKIHPDSIIAGTARHGGIDINFRATNFAIHGANRGGLLKDLPCPQDRQAPCERPFQDFGLAYDGQAYPCCNLVAGLPEHARYIAGRLSEDTSMYALYANRIMATWRRKLFMPGGKKPAPCVQCNMGLLQLTQEEVQKRQAFLEALPTPSCDDSRSEGQ